MIRWDRHSCLSMLSDCLSQAGAQQCCVPTREKRSRLEAGATKWEGEPGRAVPKNKKPRQSRGALFYEIIVPPLTSLVKSNLKNSEVP
jgi:hypothetical protein